jgi:hypothetical protein
MTQEITGPSGFVYTLREPRELTYKHRKFVLKKLGLNADLNGDVNVDVGAVLGGLEEATLGVAISSWNVTHLDEDTGVRDSEVLLIPMHVPENLDQIPAEDAALLATATKDLRKVLMPEFGPNPDEKSPTPPSAG